jgi:hypothetical protein
MARGARAKATTNEGYWWLSPLVMLNSLVILLIIALLVFSSVGEAILEQFTMVPILVWCFAFSLEWS